MSAKPIKVAVVEDDVAIAQMYRVKFQSLGWNVETASNGKLGLQLAEVMKPDIILLDLMMPEMTGDEMLQKLREQQWGEKIKVIILTNTGEQEAPATLQKLGVTKFIVKAEMTPRQVAALVQEELGQKS
ncbi:response regulator [Candidatus Saccharibacteria bacterium]|nr:response regulator [Candidatus Saccharibacteria bacterium]